LHNPLFAPSALLLTEHSDGLSEYELICLLKERCDFIPSSFAGDSLSLFRTHFLLFNALYELQSSWLLDEVGYLKVDAMRIQLFPNNPKTETVVKEMVESESVQLREYYLDIDNLTGTDREDVDGLLSQFWEKYTASDVRVEALATLELEDPVTQVEIKLAYRRKAMALHPDRGGDVEELQKVNHAMDQLKKYYR